MNKMPMKIYNDSVYVPQTRQVAGLPLNADISTEDMQTALGISSLPVAFSILGGLATNGYYTKILTVSRNVDVGLGAYFATLLIMTDSFNSASFKNTDTQQSLVTIRISEFTLMGSDDGRAEIVENILVSPSDVLNSNKELFDIYYTKTFSGSTVTFNIYLKHYNNSSANGYGKRGFILGQRTYTDTTVIWFTDSTAVSSITSGVQSERNYLYTPKYTVTTIPTTLLPNIEYNDINLSADLTITALTTTLSGLQRKTEKWKFRVKNGSTAYSVSFTPTIYWEIALPTFAINTIYEFEISNLSDTTYIGRWHAYPII
jgi:hypothetical protein